MKKLFTVAALLTGIMAVSAAQEFKTSYFLDNHVYSYRINPAAPFESDSFSFFAVGIGNTSFSMPSNLPLSSLIFTTPEGRYTWGFGESISPETFLAGITKDSFMQPELSVNLLTIGHQEADRRFTAELNVRSNTYFFAPKDFFGAMKIGLNDGLKTKTGRYNFENMHLETNNYAEVAVGFSRRLEDNLILGGTAKLLLGLGGAFIDIHNLELGEYPGDDFGGTVYADTYFSCKTLGINPTLVGNSLAHLQNVGYSGFGISGVGLGVDLGATWTPVEGLDVGFSVVDLGFLTWFDTVHGTINYKDCVIDDAEEGLQLESVESVIKTKLINFNFHVSAKYRMPFYEGLTAGILTTFQRHFTEVRLGLDVTPLRAISLAASTAFNNYGFDFGAALNFRFPGVNLFVGADSFAAFKMNEYHIPSSKGITNVTAGLAIAF
ncbi:MAG: hypothetical protein J6S97_07510 [Bacteroidales bacterium]|nr:hypothetical protein [Bacteroidales bacterium]